MELFRAHATTYGPWWFCSDLNCRFDLRAPRGTCYVGLDPATAVRERLGEVATLGVVSYAAAAEFEVAHLHLTETWQVADSAHPTPANFGVTRELGTGTPYTVSQAWATAFDHHFEGVCYQSRFTTGQDQHAVALFGPRGPRNWPSDSTTPGVVACQQAGLQVMSSAPLYDRLDIVDPRQTPPTQEHLQTANGDGSVRPQPVTRPCSEAPAELYLTRI